MLFKEMYPSAYTELRELARRHRQRWYGNYTLDSMALVSEAYLKLAHRRSINVKSRAHFLALSAKAMRQILVDYAKHRKAGKNGGALKRVSFDELQSLFEAELSLSVEQADVLVTLDEALGRLAQFDERQSQIVEYRFFGGMTIKETAAALGISVATVNREWDTARTWLYREIHRILTSLADMQ